MGNLITANTINGGAVYGVAQYEYTVDGAQGKDYIAALTAAAFKQSVAIEAAASSYVEVVRQRQRKVDDLGSILAELNKAVANLPPKNGKPDDAVSIDNSAWVNNTASSYGITLVFNHNTNQMTRGNLWKGQNNIQYALDTTNNDLQQDMVALQSLLSKRDNAYSAAAKLVRKADRTAANSIHNFT